MSLSSLEDVGSPMSFTEASAAASSALVQSSSSSSFEEGHIELLLGPMFSGKSTELLRRLNRYKVPTAVKRKIVRVAYQHDIRPPTDGSLRSATGSILTHDNVQVVDDVITCRTLRELHAQLLGYDVIGIDEGQFMTDLAESCERLANFGKIVIVAALSGTFQRTPFESVSQLMPLADDITFLKALCPYHTDTEASFTYRNQQALTADERARTELISNDPTLYVPTCRTCWRQLRSLDVTRDSPGKRSSSSGE